MNKTDIAVEVFNRRAVDYQQKFMNVSLYQESLDIFCAQLQDGAAVLDIACGPGNVAKYILNKRPGIHLHGTDLAPAMLELAAANNPSATFELSDGRDIKVSGKKYDGIISSFFFPYLSKEEVIAFISNAAQVLQPAGLLYISTMEADHATSGIRTGSKGDTIFINYHESGYMLETLSGCGFTVIDLQRKVYSEAGDTDTTDLLIVARKE